MRHVAESALKQTTEVITEARQRLYLLSQVLCSESD